MKNCYSLNIELWGSNDSHLRPMASASELRAETGKKFYKERWEQGLRQVSEECIPGTVKWLHAYTTLPDSPGPELSGQTCEAHSSWGCHFTKAATLPPSRCSLSEFLPCLLLVSTATPTGHYSVKVFPLVCLKLLPHMCHWEFSSFLPSLLWRAGAKLENYIVFREAIPCLCLVLSCSSEHF